MRKPSLLFIFVVLLLGGFGVVILLNLPFKSSLAYCASYLLFIVSGILSIKMFENNPFHRELGQRGTMISAFVIVLIAIYTVLDGTEVMSLFQQQKLNSLNVLKTISAALSSFLFTYSSFLLSFIVSNIKTKEN